MECLRHMWMCRVLLSLDTAFAGAYETCMKAMRGCRSIDNHVAITYFLAANRYPILRYAPVTTVH